jgi:hypothetical protein
MPYPRTIRKSEKYGAGCQRWLLIVSDRLDCHLGDGMGYEFLLQARQKQISEKMTNLYRTAGLVVLNGEILPDALAVSKFLYCPSPQILH